jgi:hypothetical protein
MPQISISFSEQEVLDRTHEEYLNGPQLACIMQDLDDTCRSMLKYREEGKVIEPDTRKPLVSADDALEWVRRYIAEYKAMEGITARP